MNIPGVVATVLIILKFYNLANVSLLTISVWVIISLLLNLICILYKKLIDKGGI